MSHEALHEEGPMARKSRDDDLAYEAIDRMLAALRARSPETAHEIGEQLIRRRWAARP